MEFPNGMAPVPPQMQPNNQYYPPQAPAPVRPPAPPNITTNEAAPVQRLAAPIPVPRPNPVQAYQQEVQPQPEVQVVRRNLTVAELIAVLIVAMIGVSAVQFVWGAIPKPQVNIEWRR